MEKSSIESSQLLLPIFVSWEEAQKYTRQYLIGQTFSQSQFSVKINQVFVREQNQKILAQLTTSGTYDGDICITLQPQYQAATDQAPDKMIFENTQLEMDTKNIFQKGMILLLKGMLQKQLDKVLDFDLQEVLLKGTATANQHLESLEPMPGVQIQGHLAQVQLLAFSYNAIGFHIKVAAQGQLKLILGEENNALQLSSTSKS